MKTVFIYALCEPGTRTIRDIGKSKHPKKRLKQQMRAARLGKPHSPAHIEKIAAASAKRQRNEKGQYA